MENFEGKTVVVTGAASGIGAGIARAFAREGANVVLGDISATSEVADSCRSFGIKAHSVKVDVTNRDAVERFADEAHQAFGHVDVLCNNAGVVAFGGTSS